VQVIPHVTDEIKSAILDAATDCDICIVEVAGTVGDIESLPFLEALRQLPTTSGAFNVVYVHVTLVPSCAAQAKSRPSRPNTVFAHCGKSEFHLTSCCADRKQRSIPPSKEIAMFGNVQEDAVFCAVDVPDIYQLPIELHRKGSTKRSRSF